VSPGEYALTDQTYDRLLKKLAESKFTGVSSALRGNILRFYSAMSGPDAHGIGEKLEELKVYTPREMDISARR
jgi:hypothetical protein